MKNKEVEEVMEFLNEAWSAKPLSEAKVRIWGTELAPFDQGAVMRVLRHLARTSKFRPMLSEIIEPLTAGDKVSISAVFAKVLRAASLYPPGHRNEHFDATAVETIRRLGGWDTIGKWDLKDRQWREKDFLRIYSEVVEHDADRAEHEMVRSIGSGGKSAARMLGGE